MRGAFHGGFIAAYAMSEVRTSTPIRKSMGIRILATIYVSVSLLFYYLSLLPKWCREGRYVTVLD